MKNILGSSILLIMIMYCSVAAQDIKEFVKVNNDNISKHDLSMEQIAGSDSLNPRFPSNLIIYSDYETPASVSITWSDPKYYVNGDTLASYMIDVWRDAQLIDSVESGNETYNDAGLIDGEKYHYALRARDVITAKVSIAIKDSVYCGGSPVPSAPTDLTCNFDNNKVVLQWVDPVSQEDGTPLDDLVIIYIYRNDVLKDSCATGEQTYVDSTILAGLTYRYYLKAKDNEIPPNLSQAGNAVNCFTGEIPDYLVWVGQRAGIDAVTSGDSIFTALANNGKSVFLTNDLFEFGSELSVFDAIFVVLGNFPNNHMFVSDDSEPKELETYLAQGGRIYLEGGDCFNFDPDNFLPGYNAKKGYNIRPWFGLLDGPDGGSFLLDYVYGEDILTGNNYEHNSADQFLDELYPNNASPLWTNNQKNKIYGVWSNYYGDGLAIGVVPAFGFLRSESSAGKSVRVQKLQNPGIQKSASTNSLKPQRPIETKPVKFEKKYFPGSLSKQRFDLNNYLKVNRSGAQIFSKNKTELMTAYLMIFELDNIPHVETIDIGTNYYLTPGKDSIVIKTKINNPEAQNISVEAIIQNKNFTFADTIILRDNGSHSDSIAGDQIYSGIWQAISDEDFYSAFIKVKSIDIGTNHFSRSRPFTTIGPVGLDRFEIVSTDTIANPGDRIELKIYLKHFGSVETVRDIEANFSSADSCISRMRNSLTFGDINPGESVTTRLRTLYIDFDNKCAGGKDVTVRFNIYFGDIEFWEDSLTIHLFLTDITENTQVERRFDLLQNYPNPFNPATIIPFQTAFREHIVLEIFNLLGQKVRTLVNSEYPSGFHQVEWNGNDDNGRILSSGVYLVYLRTAEHFKTNKILLLK